MEKKQQRNFVRTVLQCLTIPATGLYRSLTLLISSNLSLHSDSFSDVTLLHFFNIALMAMYQQARSQVSRFGELKFIFWGKDFCFQYVFQTNCNISDRISYQCGSSLLKFIF